MEFLGYGSDDASDNDGSPSVTIRSSEEIEASREPNLKQEYEYSKGERAIYMTSEECTVVAKHLVITLITG
jgi:hypothetical protein